MMSNNEVLSKMKSIMFDYSIGDVSVSEINDLGV